MNEETIIENKPLALKSGDAQPTVTNHQFGEKKEKKGNAWKYVTLSGTSGILMGAGLLYAGQITARQIDQTETLEEDSTTNYIADNGLQFGHISVRQHRLCLWFIAIEREHLLVAPTYKFPKQSGFPHLSGSYQNNRFPLKQLICNNFFQFSLDHSNGFEVAKI